VYEVFQLVAGPLYQSEKPVPNDQYRRFITRSPCNALCATRHADPCHAGTHWLGSEGNDTKCIVLCRKCHDQFDAISLRFRNVGRTEDGLPAIENERCCHPGFEVHLCHAGCEHLSFSCQGCSSRFCNEDKVSLDGMELCARCAIAVVEDQEPECECSLSDADLFDAAGCDFHNPNSPWNVRLRAVAAMQMYQQSAKEIA